MLRNTEFREVLRNYYVTGFSVAALRRMLGNLIFGLIFSAGLVFFIGYFALVLLYVTSGLDPFDIKSTVEKPSESIIESIIIFLFWLGFLAYLGPHSLIRFKRRLFSRLYVASGRPLASVEGEPTFDPSSEIGYNGIGIEEFYFDFEDCWLDCEADTLDKLQRAGGVMRIWYIPTEMRESTNLQTGKPLKSNCILVRAEWRPSS